MGKLKLVVLDWAGTTVDYGCFAPVAAFDKAFRAFGVQPTMDEIRAPMGMLKRDHIRTMLQMESVAAQWQAQAGKAAAEADVEAIYRVFEEKLMESLSDYAGPKPGVADTVAQLREMGLKIGSTTGYTDSMMAVVVPEAARQGYAPDYWCSPDSVNGFGRPASSTSDFLAPAIQTTVCSCLPWPVVLPRRPHRPLLLPPWPSHPSTHPHPLLF